MWVTGESATATSSDAVIVGDSRCVEGWMDDGRVDGWKSGYDRRSEGGAKGLYLFICAMVMVVVVVMVVDDG